MTSEIVLHWTCEMILVSAVRDGLGHGFRAWFWGVCCL